jgi:hypothetical protein
MEKNRQTNRVRNEKVLHIVKKDRNILHAVNRRTAKKKGINHNLYSHSYALATYFGLNQSIILPL